MATVEFDRASSLSSRNEGRGGGRSGRNNMDLDGGSNNNSRGLGWMYGRRSHEVQSEEEFVEVTLDVHDDSIVLRSVAPAPSGIQDDPEVVVMEAGGYDKRSSRSSSFGRSTSSRIKQFSQELKAEASANVKQFSQELKAELRRFSWNHSSASEMLRPS